MSGIVGIVSDKPVILDVLKSLNRLQARGARLATIIIEDENRNEHFELSGMGLVKNIVSAAATNPHELTGDIAIGFVGNHPSSADTGKPDTRPSTRKLKGGVNCSLCFSGLITNYKSLRKKLEKKGIILAGNSMADLTIHLINVSPGDGIIEKTIAALGNMQGSFSLVMMFNEFIIAARDARGSRPLAIGKLPNEGGYIFASETCAFAPVGASYVREIEPGEIVEASSKGISCEFFSAAAPQAQCSMELLNIASEESRVYGYSVAEFRKEIGCEIGRSNRFSVNYIIPSPKTMRSVSIGFGEISGLQVIPAIVRYDNVLKYIYPDALSYLAVRFGLLTDLLTSGSVVLIDDLMQSTETVRFFVRLLKTSGMIDRISLWTTCGLVDRSRCKFRRGSRKIERADYLRLKVKNLADYLGVDFFDCLTVDKVKGLLGKDAKDFCFDCLNGR